MKFLFRVEFKFSRGCASRSLHHYPVVIQFHDGESVLPLRLDHPFDGDHRDVAEVCQSACVVMDVQDRPKIVTFPFSSLISVSPSASRAKRSATGGFMAKTARYWRKANGIG